MFDWLKDAFTCLKAGAEEKAIDIIVNSVFHLLNLFGNVGFVFGLILIIVGFFALMFGTKKPLKWGFILTLCSLPFMAL